VAGRRGHCLPLIAFAGAFLLLFCWQRSRSTFLQIEQDRALAGELMHVFRASSAGVSVADILALRDMLGLDVDFSDWARATSDFAHRLQEARRGTGNLALANLEPGNLEQAVAVAIRGLTNDAVAVRRFLLLRQRFAARSEPD